MNIPGIIVSVIAYMLLGTIWYSPALFGNQWQKLTKITMDNIDKERMTALFMKSAGASVLMAVVLDYMQSQMTVSNVQQASIMGIMTGIGFSFTTLFITNLYQNKPLKLTVIDGGYLVATITLMSTLLYLV